MVNSASRQSTRTLSSFRSVSGHSIPVTHRPSNDFPRRRALPSLPLFANFPVFELASIRVPPPRRPAFLARDNQHPPPTAAAKRFCVSHSSSSARCWSAADRDW
jgi:hypothetical protein